MKYGTGEDVVLLPRHPYSVMLDLRVTDNQLTLFTETTLRIPAQGWISHVGIAKERGSLMEIRGNIVCGLNHPTRFEYDQIRLAPQGGAREQAERQSPD
jgi:hypothetical protein